MKLRSFIIALCLGGILYLTPITNQRFVLLPFFAASPTQEAAQPHARPALPSTITPPTLPRRQPQPVASHTAAAVEQTEFAVTQTTSAAV
ncbi:MAG: hypothetical protein KF832_15240, partial [Caldilineaceae bacterium]|nr:hypothetical protein [Caldilineaceae bacterium]